MKSNKVQPFSIFKSKTKSVDSIQSHDESLNEFLNICRERHAADGIDNYTDAELGKWLTSTLGNRQKAEAAVAESLEWRKKIDIPALMKMDFSDLENTGKIFFKGNTTDGSLILWWNGSRHIAPHDTAAKEREVQFIVYILESAKKKGILTDKIAVVFDRTGMKGDRADFNFTMNLLPIFQKHYPERLSKMFIFPKNYMLTILFKMLSVALRPSTIQIIALKSGPECLVEAITKENILKKYGGLLEDPYEGVVVEDRKASESVHDSPVEIEEVWSAPEE